MYAIKLYRINLQVQLKQKCTFFELFKHITMTFLTWTHVYLYSYPIEEIWNELVGTYSFNHIY